MSTLLVPEAALDGDIDALRHYLIGLSSVAKRINLRPGRNVLNRLLGQHASRFRGRGMDYAESRSFAHGDDLRRADWKLSARTGELHVKLFTEEREQAVWLCVDLHAGMAFGSRGMFKQDAAIIAASALAWAAAQRGDRVGLCRGGEQPGTLPLRNGQRGALAAIRMLTEEGSTRPATLDATLTTLRANVHTGALVVIISDFSGLNEDTLLHFHALRRHNDILGVRIADPLDDALPKAGVYPWLDVQGQLHQLDTRSRKVRSAFAEQRAARAVWFERHFAAAGLPCIDVHTDHDPVQALVEALPGRKTR